MSSNAVSGIGTRFSRFDESAWVDIAEVFSISGPGMSREVIDVTSFDSTGGYREKIASLRDAGQISLSMNFTRDGYELFKTDFESDTQQVYQIELPDLENTTFEFTGLVMELPLTIPLDDKVTMDVTIEISGQVTIQSGSA